MITFNKGKESTITCDTNGLPVRGWQAIAAEERPEFMEDDD